MERPTPIMPILASVLWLLVMIPILGVVMMSAMIFDAPGSEDNVYLVVCAAAMAMTPFLVMFSIAGMWGSWVFKPDSKLLKWGFALLPTLSIAVSVVAMLLVVIVCDGEFVCK